MDLRGWIAPQERQFFSDLTAEAENALEAAKTLRALFDDFGKLPEYRKRIKEIEHRGDEIVHRIYEALNRSFVTPLSKEDLGGLASKLDDVLDYINATATRLAIYEIGEPTKPMRDFADLILKAVEQLRAGIAAVPDPKGRDAVITCTIETNRLENLADDVLTAALAELLKDKDPIRIIKLKEIYETLEIVTDRCEDVANVLEDIVAKAR